MERYCELKQLGGLLDSKGYGIALPKGTNAHDPLFRSNKQMLYTIRVAEVVRGHGGPPPKSLDSDEYFKPEHTLFCRKSRFVAIYAHF